MNCQSDDFEQKVAYSFGAKKCILRTFLKERNQRNFYIKFIELKSVLILFLYNRLAK